MTRPRTIGRGTARERHLSVSEYRVPKREDRERELHDQLGGGALPAGGGIVLGAIFGLLLWLLIIVTTVSLAWAL
jgi:hypothetical protein